MMQASACDAFHTATNVKIYNAAIIRVTEATSGSKATMQVAKIIDDATTNLSTEEGEVYVEIDSTIGDLDSLCRIVFMDAFNDSYDQVYGIDGMTVVIESEEAIPPDVKNLAAPRGGYLWKTYYVSRPECLEPCAFLLYATLPICQYANMPCQLTELCSTFPTVALPSLQPGQQRSSSLVPDQARAARACHVDYDAGLCMRCFPYRHQRQDL